MVVSQVAQPGKRYTLRSIQVSSKIKQVIYYQMVNVIHHLRAKATPKDGKSPPPLP